MDHAYINFDTLSNGREIPASRQTLVAYAKHGISTPTSVSYSIDGVPVATSTKAPYEGVVDFSAYSGRTITVSVSVQANGRELTQKSFQAKVEGTPPQNAVTTVAGFTDVFSDDYYADAVKWAKDSGVTTGITDTTFVPEGTVTRGQAVTFLWRAMGQPAPASGTNPFSDVAADIWYTDAVLWAVEQGITNGTSGTTFSPDHTVTREQMATFIWRTLGRPGYTGQSDPYYADALSWIDSAGLLAGTGERITPGAACPRALVVTLLYQSVGK